MKDTSCLPKELRGRRPREIEGVALGKNLNADNLP